MVSFLKQNSLKKWALLSILMLGVFFIPIVHAGTFTNAKGTISDSRASATAVQYDFAFTTTVTTAIKQLTIQFCTTASGTCTTPSGITTTTAVRSDNLAGSGRTDTFNANGTLTTVVTTPATQATQAVTASYTTITNPSLVNATFFARITTYSDTGTTIIDSGTVAFAILDTTSIAVTASVDPTFSFTVAGVTSGGTVNGATTNITTTATAIPFSTLNAGTPKIGAHDLTVTTNAGNGYTISVKSATANPLGSGTNSFSPFTGTNASPAVWSTPNGTAPNTNTAFFGYTTNDAILGTGTANRFTNGGPKWAGPSTSPLELAYNNTGVSADTIRVGWQAEINALQPQGSYTGTVTLVATPTY